MYKIKPDEAEQVKLIYELYSKPECSYGDILRYFNEHGILKNGRPWVRVRIAEILRNPIYVRADLSVYEFYHSQGAIVENDPSDFIGTNGCYYYKGNDAVGRKTTNLEGNRIVLAPHEGFIPPDIWLKCRAKGLASKQVNPYQKAKNTWLAGKIKCGACGYALVDKRYKTKRSRYLLCSHKMNSRACDGAGTIYTDDMEQLIYKEMREKLSQFDKLRKKKADEPNPELTAAKAKQAQIENEIESLMNKMSGADDILFRYIGERIKALDGEKQELVKRVSELQTRTQIDYAEIDNHLTMWDELSFDDKRQTVDQLIRVIYATSDSVKIEWRI